MYNEQKKPQERIFDEWCMECFDHVDFIVTGKTEYSIFAICPRCGAKYDLINNGGND